MPEEFDFSNLDPSDPEAIQRLREAYERQVAKNAKAEQDLAAAAEAARKTNVQNIFNGLKAPGQLADLYPADAEVSEDAVKTFLRDKVGLTPDANDAWSRYEKMTERSEPPAPEVDPDEAWAKKEMAETAKFYARDTAPTEAEILALEELKAKVFGKLNEWDAEVMQGKRDPIVQPQGFGGFLDPPAYARRARHFVSQG